MLKIKGYLLGLSILSGIIFSVSEPVSSRSLTSKLVVPATSCWYRTGVWIRGGDTVTITSHGSWTNGGGNPQWVGPFGFADYSHPGQLVPNANFASLVAKVGRTEFVAYKYNSLIVNESGELLLSINDTPGTCDDNAGHINVNLYINVRP